MSDKVYWQGDCKLFRFKALSGSFHKEPMGKGIGESHSPKNPEWNYPPPDSSMEATLKAVCEYTNIEESDADWKKVSSTGGGAYTFYVDFERIRKHGGYVYYWYMRDYLKPNKWNDMSSKTLTLFSEHLEDQTKLYQGFLRNFSPDSR